MRAEGEQKHQEMRADGNRQSKHQEAWKQMKQIAINAFRLSFKTFRLSFKTNFGRLLPKLSKQSAMTLNGAKLGVRPRRQEETALFIKGERANYRRINCLASVLAQLQASMLYV